jgi:hypothetical protein
MANPGEWWTTPDGRLIRGPGFDFQILIEASGDKLLVRIGSDPDNPLEIPLEEMRKFVRMHPPDDPCGPYPQQLEWWELKKRHGDKGAYSELARRLRQAADHLDKLAKGGGWPDVFGCDYPASEPMCSGEHFIDSVGVTLSHPWPG